MTKTGSLCAPLAKNKNKKNARTAYCYAVGCATAAAVFGACGDERWRTAAPEQPEMFPSDQQAGKISPGQELWDLPPTNP